jgi:hypothetical protein
LQQRRVDVDQRRALKTRQDLWTEEIAEIEEKLRLREYARPLRLGSGKELNFWPAASRLLNLPEK